MDDVILLSKLLRANLPDNEVKSVDTYKQPHFKDSIIKTSVTLTELYQLFIVTTLQKQVKNDDKPIHPVDSAEKILCEMLKGIPKQVVGTVHYVSRLGYLGFDWNSKRFMKKEPKVIYTVEDIMKCGMEVTDCFYGLLKITNTDQLPTDNVILHTSPFKTSCVLFT